MTINELKELIPDHGRDVRLNLETVLTEEGAPGLTTPQIWGIALACSYALASDPLIKTSLAGGQGHLDDIYVEASKGAATIMAMNNVYYRSMHLLDDAELKKMPARLRMNIIGKPGVEKIDFELMCLAVSAISGCGQCLTAHVHEVRKAGLANEAIHSALRIASVVNAANSAVKIGQTAG